MKRYLTIIPLVLALTALMLTLEEEYVADYRRIESFFAVTPRDSSNC